jgi:hypothetical protein
MPRLILVASSLLLSSLAAQTARVVPPGAADVEGNRTFTYPFGRADAGVQILIDAPWVSANGGVITQVAFRPDSPATSTTYAGYTKNYTFTFWTTPVTAATMTTSALGNAGGATPTVGYSGLVTLPTAAPFATPPAPFGVIVPLTTPYVFVPSLGNLLMQVDTADQNSVPGSWNVDSVFLRNSGGIEMQVAQVTPACTSGGQGLRLAPVRTTGTLGGTLDLTLTPTPANAVFAAAFVWLGATNRGPGMPIDLGVLGMSGCVLGTEPIATQAVVPSGGAFPTTQWPVPLQPQLTDLPLYHQALGLASPPSLTGAITTETFVTRIHPGVGYPVRAQTTFYVASQAAWFLASPVGGLVPVIEFGGAL